MPIMYFIKEILLTMHSKHLRSLLAFLIALLLLFPALPAAAAELPAPTDLTGIQNYPEAPETEAPATILMEAKTGAILYQKNMNQTYYPASITKVMTALLTIENCSLDETVTFSYRATHELEPGSSSIARTEGEELSVRDCLYALLFSSANEVAQALAEHVSGSIEDFAVLMNQKAKELGCKNTHFTNPSGLNDENHTTTPYDMALIMRAAIQEPSYLDIYSTTSYTIPATNKNKDSLPIAQKHGLLKSGPKHYEYAVAGKTGYTVIAGHTLVTYAAKNNMDLICVTMGCDSSDSQYSTTRTLFEYGFNNYTMYNIAETDTNFQTNNAMLEDDSFLGSSLLSLSVSSDSWIILPNAVPFASLQSEFSWASGDSGTDTLATVTYSYSGIQVGSADLTVSMDATETFPYAETSAAAFSSSTSLDGIRFRLEQLSLRTILLVLVILVLLILVLITVFRRMARKKRRALYRKRSNRGRSRRKQKKF